MKKCGKTILVTVIFVLLLFLNSCTASSTASSSSYISSSLSFSEELDAEPTTFTEDIYFHMATEGAASNAGFYEIILRSDGSGNIYYTDFNTLSKIVLCNRLECSHDNETCAGYLPYAANIPEIMATSKSIILAYSGNPYITEIGDGAFARIEIRNPNGENARTIYQFNPNVQLDYNFAFSESMLFVYQTTIESGNSNPKKEVLRIDLLTGEATVITQFDCSSGENYYFVGVANGKLFFKKSCIDEALLMNYQRDGDISTADITKSLLFNLFTIDPETGEMIDIRSWESGETLQKIVGDSCFFVNPGSIDRFDINTQEMKRVVSGQEYCSPDTVEQVYFMDPYLVYNIHYPADDPADAVIKRFICNVETLELWESTLTTSFQGISDPISIAAFTPEHLLVGYSIEEVSPSEQDTYYSSMKRKYAILDLQDFIQNQPNYAIISED